MSIAPVISSPGPPPRRAGAARAGRVLRGIWSAFLVIVCALMVTAEFGTFGAVPDALPQPFRAIAIVGALPMLAACVLLVWRHRSPLPITAAIAVTTVVIPTSPLPALVALAAATGSRLGRVRWILAAAVWLSASASLWWALVPERSLFTSLFSTTGVTADDRAVLAWAVPVVAALYVVPFAAFGFVRRAVRDRDEARADVAAATRNVTVLHREVEREREREHLARELHDTLAARLSTVSLHAGALELTVGTDDAEASETARRVREAAQGSLDDLRSIVHVLKHPSAENARAGLGDLAVLIDQAVASGTDVRAQVFLSGTGDCDPEVSHTVYRLVQESISNARRHAAGVPIRIDLRGGPGTGVTLRATNPLLPAGHRTSTGGGHGLQGMYERIMLVGGTFQAGPTPDGRFAIVAWLPWARPGASLP